MEKQIGRCLSAADACVLLALVADVEFHIALSSLVVF